MFMFLSLPPVVTAPLPLHAGPSAFHPFASSGPSINVEMDSAYSDKPASLETDSSLSISSNPHQHQNGTNVHHQTHHEHEQETCRLHAASTLANLRQQMQLLLKQHKSLSAKNSAVLSDAAKYNDEQKVKRDELLNQMINLDKQIIDIDRKTKQHRDAKTKTIKAFSRSTTFMILQLEQLTAENRQAVIDEASKNRELKMMNEKLFTELNQMSAENARLALDASKVNKQLLAENKLLLQQSDVLAKQIDRANKQLKMKNKQITKQLNTLAKQTIALNEMNSIQNGTSRKRGVNEMEDCSHHVICDDVLDQYTKCCVCLEPYEVEPEASSTENRLPIKSATCPHTLCEDCVDNCFASLLASGKANVRYVSCPQCRSKRAFDAQNKVVDSFLREYMISRLCKAVSKRNVKSKLMTKPIVEESGADMTVSLGSTCDSLKSSTVTPSMKEL